MDLARLFMELQAPRPEPFEPGERLFWNDPHISKSMLAAHLDPDAEAASRGPETIRKSVEWIAETVGLKAGSAVLDLGCGPGLYASRFAAMGMAITGLDLSERSIAYAREHDPRSDYRVGDYTTPFDFGLFDAVLLIYGDYCVLAPERRSTLLANVAKSLNPTGRFVFDVSTRFHRKRTAVANGWSVEHGGFWRPERHLVLRQGFDYPELDLWLDQYSVVEPDGKATVYRNWFQDFNPETIRAELGRSGFRVDVLRADLTGGPIHPNSEWIGIVCSPASNAGG